MVELVIAITLLSLLSLALYGVVSVGARAASAAERRTEQARRLRIATGIITRQLHAAAPLKAPDEDGNLEPFFDGEPDRVAFVTSQPQAPDASGLAIVEYRFEDGRLIMSERPFYLVLSEDFELADQGPGVAETTLLFDVGKVTFKYRRSDFDDEEWQKEWNAADDESLPAVVSITVEPAVEGGPEWDQRIPLYVGVYNEVTGGEDFRRFG